MTKHNNRLLAQTEYGPVVGTASGGVRAWRAIPYAAPPVGALRWKPPQPPQVWTEPRYCTRFGPRAMQPDSTGWPGYTPVDTPVRYSEDALVLNVSTPDSEPPEGGWPVLFYVHGGGFMGGFHHGADGPILWGVRIPQDMPGMVFEDNADEIAAACDAFAAAVTSFITTGSPVTASVDWPTHDSAHRATLIVDTPIRVENDPHAAERAVWGDADWIAST